MTLYFLVKVEFLYGFCIFICTNNCVLQPGRSGYGGCADSGEPGADAGNIPGPQTKNKN